MLDTPGAYVMRHGAAVYGVDTHIAVFLFGIGWVKKNACEPMPPGDAGAKHARPIATADADEAEAGLKGGKPGEEAIVFGMGCMDTLRSTQLRAFTFDSLAMHAPPGIPQVDNAFRHIGTLTGFYAGEDAVYALPGAVAGAPAAANPHAQACAPAGGAHHVVVVWVSHELCRKRLASAGLNQPGMIGVLRDLTYRSIADPSEALGIVLHGTPEIRDMAVQVIDGFQGGLMRTPQEDGATAEKGVYDIGTVAESSPYERRSAGFPAKVRLFILREGGF